MVILPQGDIFAPGPVISGSKMTAGHRWKKCAYSTQSTDYNQDNRIPSGQKVFHSETGGKLHSYSLGGGMGWVCADNACSFYTGAATTAVPQAGRRFVVSGTCPVTFEDFATLSGSVNHFNRNRVIVLGTRYYEI